jgi:hypothetical protein
MTKWKHIGTRQRALHSHRSLYRARFIMTISRELPKHKFHLVGMQVRWEGGGNHPAGEHTFFYGKGNDNHELGTV